MDSRVRSITVTTLEKHQSYHHYSSDQWKYMNKIQTCHSYSEPLVSLWVYQLLLFSCNKVPLRAAWKWHPHYTASASAISPECCGKACPINQPLYITGATNSPVVEGNVPGTLDTVVWFKVLGKNQHVVFQIILFRFLPFQGYFWYFSFYV